VAGPRKTFSELNAAIVDEILLHAELAMCARDDGATYLMEDFQRGLQAVVDADISLPDGDVFVYPLGTNHRTGPERILFTAFSGGIGPNP